MFEKSEIKWEVIENILRYVKKKNLKIAEWVIFHP